MSSYPGAWAEPDLTAAVAAASRASDDDRVASRQGVRVARRIGDELRQAEAGGADDDLLDELRGTATQIAGWDERATTRAAAAVEERPRRSWRRRD